MPPNPKTRHLTVDSLSWKRPGEETYSDLTDAIERGACRVQVNHPDFTSKVKSVELQLTVDSGREDVMVQMQDSATSNETVELALGVEGDDEMIRPVHARIDSADIPKATLGTPTTTFVVKEGEEHFAPHVSYD